MVTSLGSSTGGVKLWSTSASPSTWMPDEAALGLGFFVLTFCIRSPDSFTGGGKHQLRMGNVEQQQQGERVHLHLSDVQQSQEMGPALEP